MADFKIWLRRYLNTTNLNIFPSDREKKINELNSLIINYFSFIIYLQNNVTCIRHNRKTQFRHNPAIELRYTRLESKCYGLYVLYCTYNVRFGELRSCFYFHLRLLRVNDVSITTQSTQRSLISGLFPLSI